MTRHMIQPPKDEIRRALSRACDLLEKRTIENAQLRAQLAERNAPLWQRVLRRVRR